MSKRAWLLFAACIGVIAIGAAFFVIHEKTKTDRKDLGLTEFQSELAAGNVQEVELPRPSQRASRHVG